MTDAVPMNWITGFWRRIGALIIDTLILGIFGFLLGRAFESTFVEWGGLSLLVGFFVSLAYFGLMNSKLCGGQTLGKRALDIRVVDKDNQSISFARSVLRALILTVPAYLNGAPFPNEILTTPVAIIISTLLFGGIFATLYLYIFNRHTRQSLHDLLVGTYVVNADVEPEQTTQVWKFHIALVTVVFVVAALVPAYAATMAQQEPFKDLLAIQEAILEQQEVVLASVSIGETVVYSDEETSRSTTYVEVHATLNSDKTKEADLAERIASILVKELPEARNKDVLAINLRYGFDIGIYAQWSNYPHRFDPAELVEAGSSGQIVNEDI